MILKKDLDRAQSYYLSGDQIVKALDNKVKMVLYKDLANYKTLDQLLSPYNRVVIFFEMDLPRGGSKRGHWTSLKLLNDHRSVIFTDSYGMRLEQPLKFVNPKIILKTGQRPKLLETLLYKSPYDIYFSQYRLQSKDKAVATCGRYAILSLVNLDQNEDQFDRMIVNGAKSKGLTNDEYVSLLTYPIGFK